MQPLTVSVTIARPREEVFDYIDVLANHETYMGHMFDRWSFSGPARGVGAKGRARVAAPGSREFAEFEVVESERPSCTVEEAVSAHGKRRTRGTYRLAELSDAGTEVSLEMEWMETPRSERLVPPLTRAFQRRVLRKSLRRLAKHLEQS